MNEGVAKRLEALLAKIPGEELTSLLGRRRFEALHALVAPSAEFSNARVPRYAVALEGGRLLTRPALLATVLAGIGTANLRKLAKLHLGSIFPRDADNALALASKPLRTSSVLTRDILAALELGVEIVQEVERKSPVETIDPYEPLRPLFSYQEEVRDHCLQLIEHGRRELLIQMPTGAGKTRTAMELLVELVKRRSIFANGRTVVWLAHTEELCEQAIDSFSSVWVSRGTQSARVVRLWGSYSPGANNLSGALVVAGTSRLHAMKASDKRGFDSLVENCELVVLDEAHRALAPTVVSQISALRQQNRSILIGLSATPARTTEASRENTALAEMFGRNLVLPNLGKNPIAELRKRGILARLDRVELTYSNREDLDVVLDANLQDDDFAESVLANLETNSDRNIAIVKEIEKRASALEPAIVFCCSVAHSELLASALRLRGVPSASVDCRMPRGTRRYVIQQFEKGDVAVLLNFGVLSTGFDAPNVRTVVIARPTKSMVLYSQMMGRGLRGPKMGGTATCTLVDVKDHFGRFGNLDDFYLRFKPYWSPR